MSGEQVKSWLSQITPRDVVYFIMVAVAVAVFFNTRSSNAAVATSNLAALTASFSELSQEIKRMNKEGTTGSQLAIKSLQDIQGYHEQRLQQDERSINKLTETWTDVQAKLNTIAGFLEGGKRKPSQ